MIHKLTPLFLFAFSLFITASIVQAQTAQRTFVSTSGSDANTTSLCSAANPCRSFSAALTVTSPGGEIIALTSGGYGPVEITKSVQITAPTGVYVAITAQPGTAIGGTDAIRVNAGTNDIVVIRGLTLNNVGTSNANGITFPAGERLYIENCVINGFDNHGIQVDRSTVSSPDLFVTDTIIRNGSIANSTDAGIFLRQIASSGSLIRAAITNCQLESAGLVGVLVTDRARATVRNTVSSRNLYGFVSAATTGNTSELNIENSSATLNSIGIFVGNYSTFTGGTAAARISSSAIGNNSSEGIFVNTNGTAHISDSNINGNGNDGIFIINIASARVIVSFTAITGNGGKGLNRNGASSVAVSGGSNRILENTGGTDSFSSTVPQQ